MYKHKLDDVVVQTVLLAKINLLYDILFRNIEKLSHTLNLLSLAL